LSAVAETVTLAELLQPITRAERIEPTTHYAILGARWYAKGLYIKETKQGSEIQARTLFRVERGDFVYNRLFAWKGSFALATERDHGCHVSNEFPCFAVNDRRVHPKYLSYYFSRPQAWNEALDLSSGSTPTSRNRLKEEKFLAMKFPLPLLLHQQQIVATIEAAAAQIEEAREQRRRAQAEIEALVVSVHKQLSGDHIRKICDVLELAEDQVAVSPAQSYPQVGVRSFGGGLFPKLAVEGTGTTYRNFNRLYSGAFVLSQVKGWEGAVAVCPPTLDGWFVSPEYRTFRCIPGELRPGYLASLVRTEWFWSKLSGATRGVGARRERTRSEQFLNIELSMPGPAQQRQGETIFAQLSDIGGLQNETVAEMDALLPSLLSGEFSREP
jgi:type I restriction enzyme, S subunit